MNVVDSSAWLEYFGGGPNASEFARAIQDTRALAVPSITLYEVFKRVSLQRGTDEALVAIAVMRQGRVIDVDADLAVAAADVSMETGLPMADSIILATARELSATLWTQDADFAEIPGVEYRKSVTSNKARP